MNAKTKTTTKTTTAAGAAVAISGGVAELAVVGSGSNLPAFLQERVNQPARGAEGVGMDDLVIPRLELIQSLSPCIEEGNGAYIEGAKAGMLFNNVTRELYGKSAQVIPVFFKKEYIIWKDRKKGGGFAGAFSTLAEAEAVRDTLENPDDYRINDTANQFCLLVHPETFELTEIVVSMSVTKLKVSRQWNTLIRINGGDAFTRVYELGSFLDENKAGEKYHNFTIKNVGYVNEFQFKRAEGLYEVVSAGKATMSRDDDIIDADPRAPESGNSEY